MSVPKGKGKDTWIQLVTIMQLCTFHMSEGKEKTHMHKNTMLKTTPNSLLTLQVSM